MAGESLRVVLPPPDEPGVETRRAKLNRAGLLRLFTVLGSMVLTAVLFFAAAGTLAVVKAWFYYVGLLACLLVAMAVMFVRFPEALETVNARGKLHSDVKAWDKAFGLAYTLLLLLQPVLAGFDVRHGEAPPPEGSAAPALVATWLAYAFVYWAMVVNKHAETGVRIQHERDHQVADTGPYAYVRHPFYTGLIVIQLAYPLAVGAWSAYIPSIAIIVLVVWRTVREDATLRRELAGYEDYTRRTRHRLVPWVW